MKTFLVIALVCALPFSYTFAQTLDFFNQLSDEEKSVVETISLYPESERTQILEVTKHPEILVRMQMIRRVTENKFTVLITELSSQDQKKIYNLARYPELIAEMTNAEVPLTNKELQFLLKSYPEEIKEDAVYCNHNHFSLLHKINALYKDSDQSFNDFLSGYSLEVRTTFKELTRMPAIVSLLSDNMNLTVLLGDTYKINPGGLQQDLDSLGMIVAEQKANELKEWKKNLEENPSTLQEYEQASNAIAEEEGYDDDVYDGPVPDRYTEVRYIHDDWRPYPYWFGWPAWYGYECWYPYPWWYHRGYYYGPGHVIVIIGVPSPLFVHWHFFHPGHFYHYPHFTDHMFRHYYGPRHRGSGNHVIVKRWADKHASELPRNWMNDDKNRVDRIREYGKFKLDYEQARNLSVNKSLTEREFLRSNAERYKSLQPVLTEQPDAPKTYTRPDEFGEREKITGKEKNKIPVKRDPTKNPQDQPSDRARKEPVEKAPKPVFKPSGREQQKAAPREKEIKKERRRDEPKNPPARKEPPKSAPKEERKKGS